MNLSRITGFAALAVLLAMAASLPAQTKRIRPGAAFERHPSGGLDTGGLDGGVGATVPAPRPPAMHTTTYFTLSPSRTWTGTDGKTLQASVISFEDIKVETPVSAGAVPAKPPPAPPENPTVIKDGKVRLLSGKSPFTVALANLSPADREFVESLAAGFRAPSGREPAPPPGQ